MRISFSPPDMSEAEERAAVEALRSGWITTGPKTKEFERRIAAYTHADRAVCLNSQTACAEMALRLLGVGPGDEVIVPAYTYTASASVVCHVGATLRFADIQRGLPQIDYDQLESLINEHTKAVIPVDLGGIPCDYDRIYDIVNEKRSLFRPATKLQEAIGRVAVCADAAHAFGASYRGRMIGSVADFTSFSFHAVKNLTTAEGGALAWKHIEGVDDEELYHQAQLYSLHGQSKDALTKTGAGAWEYDIIGPWYKCNMTDIAAAIGLAQLDRYDGMLERRREIIGRYDEALRPLGVQTLDHYTDAYTSSGHLYITRIPGASLSARQEIIERMGASGIAVNVHYKPLPMMTAYRNLGFKIEDYPRSYDYFVNEITLPLHTKLTDEEVGYIIGQYAECCG